LEGLNSYSQFNLINNGSIISKSRWGMNTDGTSYTSEEKVYSSYALKIVGSLEEYRSIGQQARINQVVKNQSYVLSGWAKANSLPDCSEDNLDEESRYFGLSARFVYSDGSYETQFVPFNSDVTDWQFASAVVTPTQTGKTLKTIRVRCDYSYNANTAYFDCISLTEEVTSLYDYDSKGNLISSVYGDSTTTYTYDSKGNVTSATDQDGNTTHFEYDDDGNLTGMSTNEFAMDEEEDSAGTETTTTIVGDDGTQYSIGSTYTSNGNHISSETANTGAVTSYSYDNTTDYLTSVTDALGATTSYTYVSGNGNTSSASLKDSSNNLVVSLNYTYSNGNLTSLQRTASRSGSSLAQTFSFAYDGWNNLTSVKAGNYAIASYTYDSKHGNLTSMTYGNGTKESYTYNNLDQVTEIAYNGTTAYRYTYTNDGNVSTVTDVANNTVYTYRYDTSGNVIGFMRKTAGTEDLTARNWTSADGFTKGTDLTFDGTTYTTSTTTDSQTGNIMTFAPLVGNNVTFTYDSLSQLNTRKNSVFQQTYTYKTVTADSGKTETTGQIAQIAYAKQGSTSFSGFSLNYEYDLLGNITKVTDASSNILAQYTYDTQGQLLTETLPQQDKRYEYTYDTAGNILTVKTYTATGTTATKTDSYTYGDSTWNDLLTKFNGSTITYDGGGNPLTYNNGSAWTFTWQKGRQLATAVSGSTSLSFTYDADGIRSSKTVNGTKHSYVTVDASIYQEQWGSNTLVFAYDENGLPYSVTYNGTTYYYVLNQQGDVIRIINTSGVTQAEWLLL
jgi:YD repeat-containing protein